MGGKWSETDWSDTYEGGPLGGSITSRGNYICRGTWSVVSDNTIKYDYTGRCSESSTKCIVVTRKDSNKATLTCRDGYTYNMTRR